MSDKNTAEYEYVKELADMIDLLPDDSAFKQYLRRCYERIEAGEATPEQIQNEFKSYVDKVKEEFTYREATRH
jgi:hypothetical protein